MSNKTAIINITRPFSVTAEKVYDAFLNPELARHFVFATPTGQMVVAEVDPRVGGRFLFTDRRDGEDVEHHGEFLELERPRRIVFKFSVPKYSPEWDRMEINIIKTDTGCEVNLIHEFDASWEEHMDSFTTGWNMILEGWARTVSSS